jgi:predicted nucleic acid-binding protein
LPLRLTAFTHSFCGISKVSRWPFADRRRRGPPVDARDNLIAGIVLVSHVKLATRNVKHFEEIASSVVNPWEA